MALYIINLIDNNTNEIYKYIFAFNYIIMNKLIEISYRNLF